MSCKRDLAALLILGLVLHMILSLPLGQPGTMDAHYYYGSGRRLAQTGVLEDPFIWNYLNDPAGLPAPGHLYWMPLPSLLVALAQTLFDHSFQAAQLPFVLLAAIFPLLAYATAWELGRNRRQALVAGGLALFAGFFTPYWSLPETFAPFAVVGGLALFLLGRWTGNRRANWLLGAGLLAGLGHLCRADGVLLLFAGVVVVLCSRPSTRQPDRGALRWIAGGRFRPLIPLLAGYLLIMSPWFVRNWMVSGRLLPTAGVQTLFLRTYDELYSYGTPLTLARYLDWGLGNILHSKLEAAWINVQTFVAVDNLIFLTPLTLIGWWKLRRRPFLLPALVYGLALYVVMTLLFTFPGVRGGMFHSSVALLPSLLAAAVVGLDEAVAWVARRRAKWNRQAASRFFSAGAVLLAACLSAWIYQERVIGDGNWKDPAWNRADSAMVSIGDWLQTLDPGRPVVMVGNPPAFYYSTGIPAIVVPNENVTRTLEAARRYGAQYLLLDANRPLPLAALYAGDETHPALERVWDQERGAPEGTVLFRIREDE